MRRSHTYWIVTCILLGPPAIADDGILDTIGGVGIAGYSGDGSQVETAQLGLITGLAVHSDGRRYVADTDNGVIRCIATNGVITTICGTAGEVGYSGDDGPASDAIVAAMEDAAVDDDGNLYIADTGNNVVRRIDAATGIITTHAGNNRGRGFDGYEGVATGLSIDHPTGITCDAAGNLYVCDTYSGLVRKVTPDQLMTTVAGNYELRNQSVGDNGPALDAGLNHPTDVAIASDGTLYLVERNGLRVRMVTVGGTISTIAGTGTAGYSGDGGPATAALFDFHPDHAVKVELGSAGELLVADSGNHVIRVIDATGCIETLAGNGIAGYGGDGGWAFDGQLTTPFAIACSPDGNVVVADSGNYRIREVDVSFETTTGTNVTVDVGQEISLTFDEVSSAGSVTVDVRQDYDPPITGDLNLGSDYFNIDAAASVSGNIEVTVVYVDPDPSDPPAELVTYDLAQRLLHYNGSSWEDVTNPDGVAPGPNEITGTVTSLSPFAVILPGASYAPINFRRGDANGDGVTDLSDAVFGLAYQFMGGPAPACLDAADANDTGEIDISDAIYTLSYLFQGGPIPPLPGPHQPGVDLTADPLGCGAYTAP